MTQNINDKLAQSWSDMVDGISHNLMSSLVMIRSAKDDLNPITKLIESYRIAVANGLVKSEIAERDLQTIEELVPDVSLAAAKMVRFLNVLHPFNKQLLSSSEVMTVFTAKQSIAHLLNTYPFTDQKESDLVHYECQTDFEFKFAPVFIESLLFNLLSNALLRIKRANKGKINIWTEIGKEYNLIHFKDTAGGLYEDVMATIFHRFFEKRNDEIVPGLGFCRLALLQLGGDVLCTSVGNEYTNFIIKLPLYRT